MYFSLQVSRFLEVKIFVIFMTVRFPTIQSVPHLLVGLILVLIPATVLNDLVAVLLLFCYASYVCHVNTLELVEEVITKRDNNKFT